MPPQSKANILLVDDRPENLLALEAVLDPLGENLVRAASGTEALKRLLAEDYAAVVLDVQMPEMDGFETAELIRSRQRSQDIPILFVSAVSKSPSHVMRGYSVGGVDYICKPYSPDVLRAKVAKLVEMSRGRQQLTAEKRVLAESEAAALRLSAELERRVLERTIELEAANTGLQIEVAEHRKTSARLRELAAIVEASDDAILSETLDGAIVSWNRGAERMYGYSAAEVIGRSVTILIPPDAPDDVAAVLQRIGHGEHLDHYETVRRRKDGDRLHVSQRISPVRDETGAVIGASTIARDITERKRLEAELQAERGRVQSKNEELQLLNEELLAQTEELAAQNEQLAETDRYKDRFLAMLSHELRNPLSAISNAIHVLEETGLREPRQVKLREAVSRQTEHLSGLVEDLLDIARITQGKFRLHREVTDLAEVVRHAAEVVAPTMDRYRHSFQVTLPRRPVWVEADPGRLEQVFTNLLTNAAKHSGAAGNVGIALTRAGRHALVRVWDKGRGIDGAMLPRVFDPFVQAEQPIDRPEGGLGIGLTLARTLVHLHDGTIEARSDGADRGAEFVVRLATLRGAAPATSPRPTPRARAGRTIPPGMRVLVVDDIRDAAETLEEVLELWDCDVCTARSGPEALRLAQTFRPQVVLLDIGLPEMDGYEVARRLRAATEHPQVILVAITGYGRTSDRDRALEAGFDEHLVKPVKPERLQAVLAGLIGEAAQSTCRNGVATDDTDSDGSAVKDRPGMT